MSKKIKKTDIELNKENTDLRPVICSDVVLRFDSWRHHALLQGVTVFFLIYTYCTNIYSSKTKETGLSMSAFLFTILNIF